jgi:hypothetical protein
MPDNFEKFWASIANTMADKVGSGDAYTYAREAARLAYNRGRSDGWSDGYNDHQNDEDGWDIGL